MNFKTTYYPSYPLSQFIDLVWVANNENLELKANHHAALFTELIFNYGNKFKVDGKNVRNFSSKNDHHIISGLKTQPFQTTVSGKHLNIGLMLKPHCYGLLINKFATKTMSLLSEQLFEYLIIPRTPKFDKIEAILLLLFGKPFIDSDLIKFENHLSSKLMKNGSLKDFNDLVSVSQKSFIKKFKGLYFLTPSEYVRLNQVNCATQLIQKYPEVSLTQIGLKSGFYDQSHFIRIFKKHHNCTPKQFQKAKKLVDHSLYS